MWYQQFWALVSTTEKVKNANVSITSWHWVTKHLIHLGVYCALCETQLKMISELFKYVCWTKGLITSKNQPNICGPSILPHYSYHSYISCLSNLFIIPHTNWLGPAKKFWVHNYFIYPHVTSNLFSFLYPDAFF